MWLWACAHVFTAQSKNFQDWSQHIFFPLPFGYLGVWLWVKWHPSTNEHIFLHFIISECGCERVHMYSLHSQETSRTEANTFFFFSSIWLFGSVVASMYTFSTIIHFCFDKKKELNWTRTACGLIVPWVKEWSFSWKGKFCNFVLHHVFCFLSSFLVL